MDLDKLTMITPLPTKGDTKWFQHDRFGMFIHWGLYSLAARHEWIKSREKMTTEQYQKYFDHFNPDLFDPKAWAKAAANAGMKYFIITTKHHEGFCLWDTEYTDYKITNTPYGKDVLRPMIEAFREEGLKIGLYHSLMDWHHPEYTTDVRHPMRDNEEYKAQDVNRDLNKYDDYLHAQTEELLSKYGDIDIIWFDYSFPDGFNPKNRESWRADELIGKIRRLQPNIMINDRLDWRLELEHDIITPEQIMKREWLKINDQPIVWECCHTFSGAWGYHRDEETWKTVEQLIIMLVDSVSHGGNLILNVGPTARGEFDPRALERLEGLGEWMKRHSRSIYGCTQAPLEFEAPRDSIMTYNPTTHTLYLHMLAWRFDTIELKGELAQHVDYVQILSDASELSFSRDEEGNTVTIKVPVKKPINAAIPVIEIFLK